MRLILSIACAAALLLTACDSPGGSGGGVSCATQPQHPACQPAGADADATSTGDEGSGPFPDAPPTTPDAASDTGPTPDSTVCTPLQKYCNGQDLLFCNADGLDADFVKTCAANEVCDPVAKDCVCSPQCAGKVCGPDGCGGTCGTCAGGAECGAGGTTCIAPPDGACANSSDEAIIGSGQVIHATQECGLDCISAPDPVVCSTPCISETTGLSTACATCYGETIDCLIDSCLAECAGDPSSTACDDCRAIHCDPAFLECSGLASVAGP